jgi:hypothetical protein
VELALESALKFLSLPSVLLGAMTAGAAGPAVAQPATKIFHVAGNTPTALTKSTPAHGFLVVIIPNSNPFNECWIEDDTAHVGMPDGQVGIPIGMGYSVGTAQIGLSGYYQTPSGYKPLGIVYAVCNNDTYLEIKTW